MVKPVPPKMSDAPPGGETFEFTNPNYGRARAGAQTPVPPKTPATDAYRSLAERLSGVGDPGTAGAV
jgi:hypothetical protein